MVTWKQTSKGIDIAEGELVMQKDRAAHVKYYRNLTQVKSGRQIHPRMTFPSPPLEIHTFV
jgi:hypothetical protein